MTEEKSIIDKAKDLATDVKDKVTEMVGDNEEKITGAIDKAGEFVDDKTKHKYTDKIDKAQEAAKNAVTKIAGTGGEETPDSAAASADSPTAGDADPPAAKPPATTAKADTPAKDDTPEGGPTDPIPDA